MMSPEQKISRDLKDIFAELVEAVNKSAGTNMGVTMCVFQTKPGARMNYISNLDRKDVLACYKSLVSAWEDGMPDIPYHKLN